MIGESANSFPSPARKSLKSANATDPSASAFGGPGQSAVLSPLDPLDPQPASDRDQADEKEPLHGSPYTGVDKWVKVGQSGEQW